MVKRVAFLTLCLFALSAGSALHADLPTWKIVKEESLVGFTATQMGQPFEGEFENYVAKIGFEPTLSEAGYVDVIIGISSVATGNVDRNVAVQGPDWFDSANYPQARFTVTQFSRLADGSFEATGTLTMRGVTREILLPFTFTEEDGHARVKGEVTVDRVDYGIGRGAWATGQTIGRDVIIQIDLLASSESYKFPAKESNGETGESAETVDDEVVNGELSGDEVPDDEMTGDDEAIDAVPGPVSEDPRVNSDQETIDE